MSFTSTTFKDSVAYEGGVLFITNAASVSFSSVTMTDAKARHYAGAIYAGGSGSASISFASCSGTVQRFESLFDGGFLYISNPSTTLSSSNCCYDHIKAT